MTERRQHRGPDLHAFAQAQKSHLHPHRMSPAQIAAAELVAARGVDRSDEDPDDE